MTPNEARSEIAQLASALLRFKLAVAINTPTISARGNVSRVTWPAAASAQGTLSTLPFGSLFEYRQFLVGSHYIALLIDGALLQISLDFRRDEIVGHRLCYYPCPLIVPTDVDVTDLDELDVLLLTEVEAHHELIVSGTVPNIINWRMRSPIRFDYAPDAVSSSEPASHAHFIDSDTRIPVYGPLSIGHFVRFVFRHFYPRHWVNPALNELTRWPLRNLDRAISTQDELGVHFDCRHSLPEMDHD